MSDKDPKDSISINGSVAGNKKQDEDSTVRKVSSVCETCRDPISKEIDVYLGLCACCRKK